MTGTSLITRRLETARGQVEKRFTEGGAVLLSVMDVLNTLLTSLGSMTKTLDTGTASDTTADLLATVSNLSDLPQIETERQGNLAILGDVGADLRTHIADMQETMRYLQTFAVTVKITGAGIAEFAGFAEEIRERIRSGTAEVNSFATQLNTIEKELVNARAGSVQIAQRYAQTVPDVVKALKKDAETIAQHRKALSAIARDVSAVARGVQGKVATTLSALQIGDITRQRIEHVQSTFDMLEAFLESKDGRSLDRAARARFENIVHHLGAAQMMDMVRDFQRQSRSVVETIASFSHDTQQILDLRAQMQGRGDAGDDNFMHALEDSVSAAQRIVTQVEAARLKSDQVSQSTMATAAGLMKGIDVIRSVKTDIHYMALNTNLRCSKLGEEGRSINVVTTELRIFAAKLDVSADAIVSGLKGFETAATAIGAGNSDSSPGLNERLGTALDNIHSVAETMESHLKALAEQGQAVASKISLSIARLDFQHDLGEVLAACADDLSMLAGDDVPAIGDLAGLLAPFGQNVMKLYTMMQERTVHNAILPFAEAGGEEPAAAPNTVQTDEDLFDEALF